LAIKDLHIDIIEGCKKNDRKAQEQLYYSYYDVMMNLCLRYTVCEDDAKYVLNTAFLKVFKRISEYDASRATLYTWIRTIMINSCINHARTGRSIVLFNDISDAGEVNVEPDVNHKMKAEEILRLIQHLPPATQLVFNLYVIEGYDHKEIASLLQISEGTSKWHLSDARKRLKQQLLQNENSIP
jgi:RNA polymerase sigma factor (sigma-70 family)